MVVFIKMLKDMLTNVQKKNYKKKGGHNVNWSEPDSKENCKQTIFVSTVLQWK